MSSDTLPGEMPKIAVKPYTGGPHPGAISGPKIVTRAVYKILGGASVTMKVIGKILVGKDRQRKIAYKHRIGHDYHFPTQHQRVVISRAARMGLTVKEYEVKYG